MCVFVHLLAVEKATRRVPVVYKNLKRHETEFKATGMFLHTPHIINTVLTDVCSSRTVPTHTDDILVD